MSKPQVKTLVLYEGNSSDQDGQKAVVTVCCAHVAVGTDRVDLRDEENKCVAMLKWASPVKVREI